MKKVLFVSIALLFLAATSLRAPAQARSDYKIAPHDIIIIDVFGEKDLSRDFRVSTSGTINYYFLGEVKVAGKTPAEVREMLIEELDRDYLVNPQVTVDVKDFNVREVFVNGEVNKPGSIILTGDQPLTILGALARAGGLTPRASENKIRFTRPGKMEKEFRLDELRKESRPDAKILLEAGDIIEVGNKLL
jgi:protein involved in polysaccharide export with SLBB domain